MSQRPFLSLAFLNLAFLLILSGCSGGGSPKLPISVSVLPLSSSTLQAGASESVTADLANDSSGMGVTWTVTCSAAPCGTISPMTTANGTPATFMAPGTAPTSPVNVTITATAVADTAKSASVTLILATGIVVNLSAVVNEVGAGGTTQIAAMVSNDAANKGVNPSSWSISPATGAGTLSNGTSTSVTYTAPAAPPGSDTQVTITATAASDATATGSIGITFAAIAVSLAANPGGIEATGTSTITATVSYDPANAGVNPTSWAIDGPYGTLSGATNNSVTYTAPSTPPESDAQATITAAAASDGTKTGSTSVTVLAIRISMAPQTALIPVNNGSQQFTSTVTNDPATPSQANWTLTQNGSACASSCGGLSPATTTSGTPTTYGPPTSVPASSSVTINAASVTDPMKTTTGAVTLTNGTVQIVPGTMNFGILKGGTRSVVAGVMNTGNMALTISDTSITGKNAAAFSVIANTCGASVASGASCQITVQFKSAGVGNYNAMLTISDSSADSPQQIPLEAMVKVGRPFVDPAAVRSALSSRKAPSAPMPSGASPVGTRLLDLVDSARNDPYVANGTKREIMVRLWYPALDAENCPRAEYTSAAVWQEFSRQTGIPLPRVTTNSCWDLPMTAGSHPLVIFTPGYTGTFTDYTFLFEDLASRGYVVASVDHTYEATAVEFPDGRLALSVLGSHLGTAARSDEAAMVFAVSVRLRDLGFMMDQLDLMNRGADTRLAGKLDMTRVALAGHSLGGLTTILGVAKDARFRTGIVIDGVELGLAPVDTDTPMLLLAAGRDAWSEEEHQLWNSLRGPRMAVNFVGAEHVTPSDLVWLAMGAVETGTMGPQKTIEAVRNYVAAFLEENLVGRPRDVLLTEPAVNYPDAVVTLRGQPLHVDSNVPCTVSPESFCAPHRRQ
jgi:dienelactone hydrolase